MKMTRAIVSELSEALRRPAARRIPCSAGGTAAQLVRPRHIAAAAGGRRHEHSAEASFFARRDL
jgi:hypothetical protein